MTQTSWSLWHVPGLGTHWLSWQTGRLGSVQSDDSVSGQHSEAFITLKYKQKVFRVKFYFSLDKITKYSRNICQKYMNTFFSNLSMFIRICKQCKNVSKFFDFLFIAFREQTNTDITDSKQHFISLFSLVS